MLRRPRWLRPGTPPSTEGAPADHLVLTPRSGQGRLTGVVVVGTAAGVSPEALAASLTEVLRDGDLVAPRGEVVTVVAPGLLTERDLRLLATRVMAVAGRRAGPGRTVGGGPDGGPIGVGLALGGPGPIEAQALVEGAVTAHRASVRTGGDPVRSGDERFRDEQRRADLVADLSSGIEAGRFGAHLQPIVALDTGAVVAFEALARWRDPVRQLVLPAAFVDVAAEAGLLGAITEQVLTGALAWVGRWERSTGRRRRLLLPVHPSQVTEPGSAAALMAIVGRALAASGIGPETLVLAPGRPGTPGGTASPGSYRRAGDGPGRPPVAGQVRASGLAVIGDDDAITVVTAADLGTATGPGTRIVDRLVGQGREVLVRDIATDDDLGAARASGAQLGQGFRIHRPVPPERLDPVVRAGAVEVESAPGR